MEVETKQKVVDLIATKGRNKRLYSRQGVVDQYQDRREMPASKDVADGETIGEASHVLSAAVSLIGRRQASIPISWIGWICMLVLVAPCIRFDLLGSSLQTKPHSCDFKTTGIGRQDRRVQLKFEFISCCDQSCISASKGLALPSFIAFQGRALETP